MPQPHSRAKHPPNSTSFDPPSPHTHTPTPNTTHNHIPSAAFTGPMAQTYNHRTGGCNLLLANRLLALTAPSLPALNTTRTLRILDNASGPMVLTTQCLLNPSITSHPAIHISTVDLSADFVAANRATLSSNPAPFNGNGRKVDTAIMDGLDLQFPDDSFDLSFTSLTLFAFLDPVKGARELFRTLKPGGVAAASTWKSVGWLPLLHEVEAILAFAGVGWK